MLRKATAFPLGGLLTTAETEMWILWVIIIIILLLLLRVLKQTGTMAAVTVSRV